MFFGNQNDYEECSCLDKKIKECLDYAKTHDLREMKPGSYEIDGDRLSVNIMEYETVSPEERFWEAHKKYGDLHLMIDGTERIDLNFLDYLEQGDYVEKDDYQKLEGKPNSHVILTEGDFLYCGFRDGHRTGIMTDQREKIKKAVFKIRLS